MPVAETPFEGVGRFVVTFAALEWSAALVVAAARSPADFQQGSAKAAKLTHSQLVDELRRVASQHRSKEIASLADEFQNLLGPRHDVVHGLWDAELAVRVRDMLKGNSTPPFDSAHLPGLIDAADMARSVAIGLADELLKGG